jgi:hypothetical protein
MLLIAIFGGFAATLITRNARARTRVTDIDPTECSS